MSNVCQQVRYYFSKGLDFGGDGDFSEERFANVLNADLANDLGNMLTRYLLVQIFKFLVQIFKLLVQFEYLMCT